ncbi:MAG: leucyl aminopeptidase [Acidobacteriota bacterium]|nr:leucyl aminopeptidase [Acidobacteriota bacterium]
MKISVSPTVPSAIATPLLVLAAASTGDEKTPSAELLAVDAQLLALAAPLLSGGDVTGKFAEAVWLLAPSGISAQRVLFIGAGKKASFGLPELRKLAGAAARAAKAKNIKEFTLVLPSGLDLSTAAVAATEGVVTGDFDVDVYRSERKDQSLLEVTLAIPQEADAKAVFMAVAEGAVLAESQNLTRELALEPGNKMTPTILANRAREMSEEAGLTCEIHGPGKIKELGMGAFWSVAQGSEEEPRLVVLRYEPEGAREDLVLGLVGKGITFDSGGISLKPGDGMEKMKYDMTGAATMIGAMRAIAMLRPKVRVLAVLCCTENMPDGKAQKPGDVQIAMNGKSIEVINTDAEGRLVLADGLCYARQLGATHLIDAATLTGAVVVALGYHNVGVFSNDDAMATEFLSAASREGEKMWRLPVEQDYFDHIRSEIADIKNTGGRWGGAITAAMFLKEFVADKPWVHLDVAGTAWMEEAKAWMPKGPSGVAVRSIVNYARHLAEQG